MTIVIAKGSVPIVTTVSTICTKNVLTISTEHVVTMGVKPALTNLTKHFIPLNRLW